MKHLGTNLLDHVNEFGIVPNLKLASLDAMFDVAILAILSQRANGAFRNLDRHEELISRMILQFGERVSCNDFLEVQIRLV
ncbi:MAG: hypothetical protein WC776_05550, partial [Patescibacteria group bacterium]